jgi:uncharacterized protein
MIMSNEFTVNAGIDEVWRQLLDMEGVATCLPGATVKATDDPRTFDGLMKLKIGPMRVEYAGSATLTEVDDDNHVAVISLKARESRGQGGALATVRNTLHAVDGGTRVVAETDLKITGAQAQFGRGVIEDVGKRVLAEFSQRLEDKITGDGQAPQAGATGDAAAATPTTGATAKAPMDSADDVLDVGGMLPRAGKLADAVVGAVGSLALAIRALFRRRR